MIDEMNSNGNVENLSEILSTKIGMIILQSIESAALLCHSLPITPCSTFRYR